MVREGYREWLVTASQGSRPRLDLQVAVTFKGLLASLSVKQSSHTKGSTPPPKSISPRWGPDIQAKENSERKQLFLEGKIQLFTEMDAWGKKNPKAFVSESKRSM